MKKLIGLASLPLILSYPAFGSEDVVALKKELEATKASVSILESRITEMERKKESSLSSGSQGAVTSLSNAFNPAISAVLSGGYNYYSDSPDDAKIPGYVLGEEAGLPNRGFSLGESEITVSANIDSYLFGAVTVALEDDAGDTEIGLEEAYLQTLSLPYGMKVKAGRMFPVFGYFNEIHPHADRFVDRPLPYRAYIGGNNLKDDGVQFSVVLPTDLFVELGGGVFRGIGFPGAGSSSHGTGTQTLFGRVGGDIGNEQSWLAGISYLRAESDERDTDGIIFTGTNDIVALSGKYVYAPDGNVKESSLTLQGEWMLDKQDGEYNLGDASSDTTGWYAQAVYQWSPRWNVGYRYARLSPDSTSPALVGTDLDDQGHYPTAHAVVLGFAPSEFSQIRLQYQRDDSDIKSNNQLMLRYTVSLGAHGAHQY